MKPKNLLLTTALAAVLAGPVTAQSTDSQIGSYSVGEFLDLAVMTSDGSDAGRVQAVVEGSEGTHVLVSLEDKIIALPLDAFSLADNGEDLVIDRSMEELQQMAAFEPSDELELSPDTQMADTMGSGADTGSETASGETGDMAETEELETTVVEGASEDVTVVTTDPSAVETESAGQPSEMAEGETESGAMEQDEAEIAQSDTGAEIQATEPADATGQPGGTISLANMTVGEILGMDVTGANDENIGEIDYIFEDANQGYMAVIGVGGFLGLGEHTVAVPLGEFSMGEDGSSLRLDSHTEADLEAMPEVDESGLEGLPDDHVISA